MTTTAGQLTVSAIENGTVLDHIPSEKVFDVMDILGLDHSGNTITIGINLDSKSLNKKGIIKVAERFFEDHELNRIALVAPTATINVIKGFKVVEKKHIHIPDELIGIAKCANPLCITNNQRITTKFRTIKKSDTIELLCHYCEKATDIKKVKIISYK
ncbi:MAG: aspartate carbamoyltransferase regulatory subunit [Bacteroidales bacterium]|nr:aspartate carbamoyltransferase regulatory subunit [Bacteroidales bacterium]